VLSPRRRRKGQAGQVVDAGLAVVTHGGHRRVPGHPEVPGGLGDRALAGPDPPADLRPDPFGQHRPRGDLVAIL
jgi:hypothetical protein